MIKMRVCICKQTLYEIKTQHGCDQGYIARSLGQSFGIIAWPFGKLLDLPSICT